MIDHLHAHPAHFNITVLTRDASKLSLPHGVMSQETDYSYDSLRAAFRNQDAVVNLINLFTPGSVDAQIRMIDAAAEAGVKRFVPSDFGCDPFRTRFVEVVPPLAPKKDVIEYLRTKEREGFTWTALGNGSFFDKVPTVQICSVSVSG